MNEKKFQIKNTSYDFSKININKNIMNKTFNKDNNNSMKKISTQFKKEIQNYKNKMEIKFKRIWSSQNIFLSNNNNNNNINNINKNKHNLFYNNNIYSGSSIYSAPTVKQNRIEIARLIQDGKNKRLNYVNNLFNSIMIKESKLYRKKLKLLNRDTSFDNNDNYILKRKYNMNDMNELTNIKLNLHPIVPIEKKRNLSSYDLYSRKYANNYINDNTLSTNKTNYFSKNISGKITMKTIYENKNKKNDINTLTKSTKYFSAGNSHKNKQNKNYRRFGYLRKKKTENPIVFLYKEKEKEKEKNKSERGNNSFHIYNSFDVSKMSLELNDLLFNKKRKDENINEVEKKLIIFKAVKGFQKTRLDIMSNQDINGLEKTIELLQKRIKKYNQISFKYFRDINNYIHFLKDKKYSIKNSFEEENNKRFNLFFDIEKLVNENILKQKELEHLIEIRHFLIQVKNYLIKQPNYFIKQLKEISRKYELGKLILSLKNHLHNQNVIRFLESIPEINNVEIRQPSPCVSQAQTKSSANKLLLKKKSKQFRVSSIKTKSNENSIIKYLNNVESQIFDSPEDFIIILDNIEYKNLRLIKENDYIKRSIFILQKQFEDLFQSNTFLEKFNDINKKEEILKKLKEENTLLQEKYNYLKNNRKEEESNCTKNKNKENNNGFYMDLNIFKKISYYKKLEDYKYRGLFLLEKLLDIIKDFFALNYTNYGIDQAYKIVQKNILNKILNINKKNINNINNIFINDYILCLLKLYENICEFIKYKDKEYNSIEDNKYIIHKKKEEIQLQRKIVNTKLIRQLAEEKRLNSIEKIAKRNNKPKLLFRGNVDQNVVLKNKNKKYMKIKEIGKNKNNIEKEFNYFVRYDNNNS